MLCIIEYTIAPQNDWRNVGRPSSGNASQLLPLLVIII